MKILIISKYSLSHQLSLIEFSATQVCTHVITSQLTKVIAQITVDAMVIFSYRSSLVETPAVVLTLAMETKGANLL
jgi:hypothetical protein